MKKNIRKNLNRLLAALLVASASYGVNSTKVNATGNDTKGNEQSTDRSWSTKRFMNIIEDFLDKLIRTPMSRISKEAESSSESSTRPKSEAKEKMPNPVKKSNDTKAFNLNINIPFKEGSYDVSCNIKGNNPNIKVNVAPKKEASEEIDTSILKGNQNQTESLSRTANVDQASGLVGTSEKTDKNVDIKANVEFQNSEKQEMKLYENFHLDHIDKSEEINNNPTAKTEKTQSPMNITEEKTGNIKTEEETKKEKVQPKEKIDLSNMVAKCNVNLIRTLETMDLSDTELKHEQYDEYLKKWNSIKHINPKSKPLRPDAADLSKKGLSLIEEESARLSKYNYDDLQLKNLKLQNLTFKFYRDYESGRFRVENTEFEDIWTNIGMILTSQKHDHKLNDKSLSSRDETKKYAFAHKLDIEHLDNRGRVVRQFFIKLLEGNNTERSNLCGMLESVLNDLEDTKRGPNVSRLIEAVRNYTNTIQLIPTYRKGNEGILAVHISLRNKLPQQAAKEALDTLTRIFKNRGIAVPIILQYKDTRESMYEIMEGQNGEVVQMKSYCSEIWGGDRGNMGRSLHNTYVCIAKNSQFPPRNPKTEWYKYYDAIFYVNYIQKLLNKNFAELDENEKKEAYNAYQCGESESNGTKINSPKEDNYETFCDSMERLDRAF